MNSRMLSLPALSLCSTILLVGACQRSGPDYGSLDLSTARGKVTLDGQPLPGALVLFEADDQTFSWGLTDSGGNYELMFNSEKEGVTKGRKTVRIWSSRGVPGMSEVEGAEEGEDPDARPSEPEKVPARYNEQSELEIVVEKRSEVFDFDL